MSAHAHQKTVKAFCQAWESLDIEADEQSVVIGRLDSFELAGNSLSELAVLGIFEFNAGGEISH